MLSAVAIFVVTFLSVTVADGVCPKNWSLFQGSCYRVGPIYEDYYEANWECSNGGGVLAEITSEEENEFVKGLLSSAFPNDGETKAYIGVFLDVYASIPEWVTYQYYDAQSFFDWVNPDWESYVDIDSNEYCASMSKEENWSWVVGECDLLQNSVCEREPKINPCIQESCYKLLSETHTFSDIQDKCKAVGGNVLEINSQEEQDFVTTFLSDEYIRRSYRFGTKHIWLGATDDGSEGEFRWLSTQEKIDYTQWSDGEPNNSGVNGVAENCVVLDNFKDFTWNDAVCDGDHAVVCEIASTSGITG